ncbi:MAG TPA: hypothetical protein VF461_15415 [Gemmatimonadaceae bacterium]
MTASRFVDVLALSAVAMSVASAQTASPTRGWPTTTPQAVGLDAKVLAGLDSEITSGRYGSVDRMLVIRHGRVVINAWNIPPARTGLPRSVVIARMISAIVDQ